MAGGGLSLGTRVIQVTNIAPQATKDQMQSLFSNIGKIDEIRLYPTVRDVSCPVQSRICYIKFVESSCVLVAQHLTNTVFIDRALIVIPVADIPEEYRALEMLKNGTIVPGLHKPDSKLPPEVVNRIEGQSPQQVIKTYDPKLLDNNLPEYPALPSYYDSRKIEEIRRTIIVCDVKNEWRLDDLMDYFARAGEVKYARWAEKNSRTYCMIEFCEQYSVINALKLQGHSFKNGRLNIYHSTDSITKPEAKSNEAAQREIEEAMKIVKEAQYMISAAIDPVIGMLAKDKRRRSRSRSRSREHRRSRSRSSRHSSRSRRRTRSRTRSKRTRSRSRTKRSRSIRKSRSESRSKRTKSRDKRSRSRRRRSPVRSSSKGSHVNRSKSRQQKRSHSKDQKRSNRKEEKTERSRSRSKHSRSQSSRNKESKKTYHTSSKHRAGSTDNRKAKKPNDDMFKRDYDAEEKLGQSSQDDKHRKSESIGKSDNMDISNSP